MKMEAVRLQKYLSDCGVASRRKAEELIIGGQVKVNGRKVELGTKIETADATLDAAIKAVQKNLDDAEAALEKAIADGDKALSDEIAKLREEMTQADDKAQTTQIVLGTVAGVAVAGDISLLAWLLLKRKKGII